ncbi:hypothetical protein EDB81DRAFT_791530 [Dactylonectria macrodidyma]|uniref:RelA/SpoT domain-containing protein n=1 Tax=Dactylonectria macrodidyma TaxID=307937 RepID=A0A9P9F6G0_9HYPO|nr:hypothetical protein EDB81DRAFT_791530 [Dactylonectria macrodidyma]
MTSSSSAPLSQVRDCPTALSVINRELQAKIHEFGTKSRAVLELESIRPSKETKGSLGLVADFNITIWPGLISDYEALVNELVFYCRDELLKRGLRCMVHGRTKAVQSVSDSLKRREQARQKPFTDLSDIFYEMHDLAGVMIVVQSEVDVARANKFVSESFREIKTPNYWSSDRPVGQHWNTRFGNYESHNHHVSLKGDSEYSPVIFEVQVTTFKDFVYNQYAHPWFYKGRHGALTDKDEIVMDMIHGASYLIEMGGEYFLIREKENRDSIEVEHDMFQANPLVNGPRSSRHPHSRPYNKRTKGLATATADKILMAFQYDINMVTDDCNNILKMIDRSRQRNTDDDIDEERVLAIQSHHRLRTWFAIDQPSMILLDGRGNPGPKSEASLVSAKLTSALLKLHIYQDKKHISPIIVPLTFFCGEHRDFQRDPNANATELALSLLLQLVDRGRDFIAQTSLQRILEVVDPEDFRTVCASLCDLLTDLPKDIYVVIIIDGLKFFNQPLERKEETEELVINLVSAFRQGPPATLKLLLTGPPRISSFEGLFQEDEILRLGRDLPPGAAVNDLTWRRPLTLR